MEIFLKVNGMDKDSEWDQLVKVKSNVFKRAVLVIDKERSRVP